MNNIYLLGFIKIINYCWIVYHINLYTEITYDTQRNYNLNYIIMMIHSRRLNTFLTEVVGLTRLCFHSLPLFWPPNRLASGWPSG